MKILNASIFWLLVWTFTSLLYLKLCLIKLWCWVFDPNGTNNRCHDIACQWGSGVIAIGFGWDYSISGKQHLPNPGEPVVIVANHQSSVDICALFTTSCQFRWLSKTEVFKIPLIGHAMNWAGYVPIRRGDSASHRQALDTSANWIRNGISMVYFPEGSRSLDGRLKPFKSGAFRLAEQEGVKILPICLQGTRHMMAKNSIIPQPAKVRIDILPPAQRQAGESIEQFMARVRETMAEELNKNPSSDFNVSYSPLLRS